MDTYRLLFRHALFPLWERVLRRRPTLSLLENLERTQWNSREQLENLQLHSLRRLLSHAATNIPYYRDLFVRCGFDPNHVQSVSDLRVVPRLTRDIIRERYADLVDRRTAPVHIHKRTSGSSGAPLRLEYDPGSESWRKAVRLRGYAMAGYEPGMRALYYWGLPMPTHGWGDLKTRLDRLLRRECFVDCYKQDENALAAAVNSIRRHKPQCIVGFTIATGILARYIVDRKLRDWDPITVLCAAEATEARDRKDISEAFGGPTFETYGARETMLIATECSAHEGLHTMDEELITEIDIDNRPARPGETGDVLVTDLHNYGMPLIRYQIGDLAVARAPTPCACGRGLQRIERVVGRQSDTLRNAKGDPVPGIIVHSLLTHVEHGARQAQVIQHESGTVTVRLVPGPEMDRVAAETLAQIVRKYLLGLPVSIQIVDAIEKGAGGKHRCVIVERPASQTSVEPQALPEVAEV